LQGGEYTSWQTKQKKKIQRLLWQKSLLLWLIAQVSWYSFPNFRAIRALATGVRYAARASWLGVKTWKQTACRQNTLHSDKLLN